MEARKIRFSQIKTDFGWGNEHDGLGLPNAGEHRYLILVSPVGGSDFYRFQDAPGRTNMDHREVVDGWLGMTNNVNAYADGYYEVTGRSSTHIHLTRADAPGAR